MHTALMLPLLPVRSVNLPAVSGFPDRAPTASWTNFGGGSLSANYIPGPDGRNGSRQAARTIEGSGSVACISLVSNTTFTGSTALWRVSVYLKPYGPAKRFVAFYIIDGTFAHYSAPIINLGTGVVETTDAATYTLVRHNVKRLNNGWFRLSQFSNLAAEAINVNFNVADTAADAISGVAYSGDGFSGALIWGIDVRLADGATG